MLTNINTLLVLTVRKYAYYCVIDMLSVYTLDNIRVV